MYKHYALQQIYVKIFKKFKSTDCQNLESMKNHYLNLQLVLFFALVVTFCSYKKLAISKHFPIKLQLFLIRAETLEYALHRQLSIPRVELNPS
jgi:hypothetical protein